MGVYRWALILLQFLDQAVGFAGLPKFVAFPVRPVRQIPFPRATQPTALQDTGDPLSLSLSPGRIHWKCWFIIVCCISILSRPADPLPKSTSAYCLSGSRWVSRPTVNFHDEIVRSALVDLLCWVSRVSRSADLLIKSSAAYCPCLSRWAPLPTSNFNQVVGSALVDLFCCISRVSRSLVLIPKTSAGYFSSVSRTCFLPLSGPRFFSTQKVCSSLVLSPPFMTSSAIRFS